MRFSEDRRNLVVLLVIQVGLLSLFTYLIPLHRRYTWADSGEYQRMALFLVGKGSLAGGYTQFFVPGLPAVVGAIYLVVGDIDIASLIANFMFSLAAILIFLKLSRSLRLSIAMMFIPVWFIASFSTLSDASFIALELAAVYLLISGRETLSLLVAAISAAFRSEALFLILVLLAAIAARKDFKIKHLVFPALALIPSMMWGELAFGDPLITLRSKAAFGWNMPYIATILSRDLSLGLVGVGQIGYVILTVIASVLTIWKANQKFGFFNVLTLLALAFTVLHTVFSPVSIFPDMARLYLQVAPVSLFVFQPPLEKRFLPILLLLVPLAVFTAYAYWAYTFNVAFI